MNGPSTLELLIGRADDEIDGDDDRFPPPASDEDEDNIDRTYCGTVGCMAHLENPYYV
jgi:hypothetical protein